MVQSLRGALRPASRGCANSEMRLALLNSAFALTWGAYRSTPFANLCKWRPTECFLIYRFNGDPQDGLDIRELRLRCARYMTIDIRRRRCRQCIPERRTIGWGHVGDLLSTVIGGMVSHPAAALGGFAVGASSQLPQARLPLRPSDTPGRLRVRALDRGSAVSPQATRERAGDGDGSTSSDRRRFVCLKRAGHGVAARRLSRSGSR
jgi:hypothetical protein